MRENILRKKLAMREPFLNGWLSTGHPLLAETLGRAGFDSVTVDMQHGTLSSSELLTALQAISTSDAVPLVRVAANDPAACMQALDFGAYGVICPMIDSAEDAARFISYCRYPPVGMRSYGPIRGLLYGGADYPLKANDELLAIAMIETAAGLENLDSILRVPGLDAIFVGPADLSQALGIPVGPEQTDGPVWDALSKIIEHCRANGVPAGVFTKSLSYASRMIELGFTFVTVGSDLGYVTTQAAATVKGFFGGPGANSKAV